MKIKVFDPEENKRFFIWIPTHLLMNSLFATVAPPFINDELKKYGVNFKINGRCLRKFVRGFYKARKRFGKNFNVVEVESSDGSIVKITI